MAYPLLFHTHPTVLSAPAIPGIPARRRFDAPRRGPASGTGGRNDRILSAVLRTAQRPVINRLYLESHHPMGIENGLRFDVSPVRLQSRFRAATVPAAARKVWDRFPISYRIY